MCPCDVPIGIFAIIVFEFCEDVQRKQKRVVCLMADQ